MCNLNIQNIVKILLKDGPLLEARKKFARLLKIPENSLKEFEDDHIRNNDLDSYFCKVLKKWKSMKGIKATILKLSKILRDNKFVASADRLDNYQNSLNNRLPYVEKFIAASAESYKDCSNNRLPRVENSFNKYYASRFLIGMAIAIAIYFVHRLTVENQMQEKFKVTDDEGKDKDENEFTASADRWPTLSNFSLVSTFGVKDPVFNFVGRGKELNQLNELFKVKKAYVVLISAMGGKGKTELCRKFIQQLPKDVETLVTWFSGDGPQQFQQSLNEIRQSMKIPTIDLTEKSLTIDKLIENISSKRKSKWVVIMDNVDKVLPDFLSALDSFHLNEAFVVFTSRRTDIIMDPDEYILLGDLEDKDAWELVKSTLKNNQSQKLVAELCEALQNYPLALQQAVSFIKQQQRVEDDNYGIHDYLQELNSDKSNIFDHQIPARVYNTTLLKVFEQALRNILIVPNHNALSLLQILSLVQPDGIEKEFLEKLFSLFELKKLFESSLSILKSFSLIGVNKGKVYVHRIFQILTRNRMKAQSIFPLVIEIILLKLKVDKLTKKEIVHVCQILKIAVSELNIIEKTSNFPVRICIRLFDMGLYKEMKELSEIISQQFVTVLRPDHINTLRIQTMLGIALEYNGEYKDALLKLQLVWEKEKKVLGEEHKATLYCKGEIANVLRRLKKFNESLKWHENVLKSQLKVHGKNHESTMTTMNNMANVLNEQGIIEEASTIYKNVLEWKEREVGHEHPHTLSIRHNIAICLFKEGKFEKAKKEFEELFELRVLVLSEDHAKTLNTKYWLTLTLYFLGQKEKSLEMMEQVLIFQEKALGANHPDTNMTRDQISEWRIE